MPEAVFANSKFRGGIDSDRMVGEYTFESYEVYLSLLSRVWSIVLTISPVERHNGRADFTPISAKMLFCMVHWLVAWRNERQE